MQPAPRTHDQQRRPARSAVRPASPRTPITAPWLSRRVARVRARVSAAPDLLRLGRAFLLGLIGLLLIVTSGMTDPVLHRGVETGEEVPYVQQNTGRELAVNVDLTRFDPAQIDSVLATLQTSGFVYLRQPVSWASIEATQGTFDWTQLDSIIDRATARGMKLVTVIENTPDWARRASERGYADAAPSDPKTLAAFTTALITRYATNIQFIQFMDRPNLPERWGGSTPSPAEYVQLLAAANNAARGANAEIKILLAELDPKGSSGQIGDDFDFIRQVYAVGGAPYFDIMSLQLDGGTHSPSDRSVSEENLNLSRAIALRELMIDQGDRAKSIWATRYGWAASPDLSNEVAADYGLEGIQRAREEWPWMGPMFGWSLIPEDPWGSYSLLNADGTAKPQFQVLADYGASGAPRIAATGYAPMLSSAVDYSGSWNEQHLNGRVYQTSNETNATLALRFSGTGIDAILRESPDAGMLKATLDGKPLQGSFPVEDGASMIDLEWFQAQDIRSSLASGLDDGEHELVLSLAGEGRVTIGGLIVTRRLPMVWPIIVLSVAGLIFLIAGFRDFIYVIAQRWGHLDRPATGHGIPSWGYFSERWTGRWSNR